MRKVSFMLAVMVLVLSLSSVLGNTFAKEQEFLRGKSVNVNVMSYNIHHGEGVDGVLDLERIARVIEEGEADIVGLQEVDNHFSERSDFQDQAKWLANRLGMFYTYAANLDYEPLKEGEPRRQYGTAVLSKYPILKSENHLLPKIGNTEQRGLTEVTINVKGNPLRVYNTHLSHVTSAERQIQMEEVIAITEKSKGPKVIMGDLNAAPESNEMKLMYANYIDAFANQNDAYTHPAENPTMRIDYIFTSNKIETNGDRVIDTLASDHLPLMTTIVVTEDVDSAMIQALVERFEKEGEFKNAQAARALNTHLTAVAQYEKKEAGDKVVKHMKGFKVLLDAQKKSKLISDKAYNELMASTDAMIEGWK